MTHRLIFGSFAPRAIDSKRVPKQEGLTQVLALNTWQTRLGKAADEHPELVLPPKRFFGSSCDTVVEERRAGLQVYLNKLVSAFDPSVSISLPPSPPTPPHHYPHSSRDCRFTTPDVLLTLGAGVLS